ncbi:Outer membrane autotransporter barrel domain protein [Hyella patelloides LEGE 07179]|uniref:Outer membrane autotransporter barrel domain protein n=1 Tax=Hyella patelloides LEGE 07179 TaxID=945734 RepID=A0A563W3Z8_9CYAN|nr:nidogen-like domain-containing protein [Hyella patelloides]VEP18396.1 Outer membrane autotransporter barrel domain protein [Hyella patelloides LEGE 07179]
MNRKNVSGFKATSLSLGMVSIALGTVIATPQFAEAAAVRSGFDSNVLAANDDGSTGLVPIGFEVNLGGLETDELYVNNNGNVTFDDSLSTFTPFSLLETNQQIIAPFFADVDTRGAGSSPVTYGMGTVDGRDAFGVNWVDVGYFNSNDNPLNSFQLVLIDRSDVETGGFDIEFNYDQILWESGQASGSDENGLGGNSARAGFAYGVGDDRVSLELDGSAVNGALLDNGVNALINDRINRDVDGGYLFTARGGEITIDPVDPVDPPVDPDTETTPEPASILGLLAMGTIGVLKRKKSS